MVFVPYEKDNIFRKIIDGTIPSYKIFETDRVLAILDAFPLVPGHALLMHKGEYASVVDMPEDVTIELFREPPRLAKAVRAATGCEGINIVQNNGAASGQAVFHAHVHVIPRFKGDGKLPLPSGTEMIKPEAATAMLDQIKGKL
ncbi:TPA: hypothetical protein N0F65_006218 [Lagenidium giganteum]|uniref:HIT domain-containing protein n=1 Tax=Lagenidium giganteum TaxID=4803 RepID=A0AAV2Z688_9STRA|nr:TPA: hypothetical protein N0F65_006218 [Lagenidium giganteum]